MNTFYTELKRTAEAFEKAQESFFTDGKRQFFKNNSDQFKNRLIDTKAMKVEGEVTYAALVQANSILFNDMPAINCPAAIVFSNDEYYQHNPQELRKIASMLFSYKNNPNPPKDIKKIIKAISNEYISLYNQLIPVNLTEGREVYYTAITVFRCHLPGNKLVSNIFPIVNDIHKPKETCILPYPFWTQALEDYYMKRTRLYSEPENSNLN